MPEQSQGLQNALSVFEDQESPEVFQQLLQHLNSSINIDDNYLESLVQAHPNLSHDQAAQLYSTGMAIGDYGPQAPTNERANPSDPNSLPSSPNYDSYLRDYQGPTLAEQQTSLAQEQGILPQTMSPEVQALVDGLNQSNNDMSRKDVSDSFFDGNISMEDMQNVQKYSTESRTGNLIDFGRVDETPTPTNLPSKEEIEAKFSRVNPFDTPYSEPSMTRMSPERIQYNAQQQAERGMITPDRANAISGSVDSWQTDPNHPRTEELPELYRQSGMETSQDVGGVTNYGRSMDLRNLEKQEYQQDTSPMMKMINKLLYNYNG